MKKLLGMFVSALEWYDSAICIALATVISKLFFPEFDSIAQFLLYFSSLAIGYLGRPLGAFVFGYYSDKYDRIHATYYSLLLMTITSIFISILPIYASVGTIAPVLFVCLRFLQGVAIGGNYGVSVAIVEQAENNKYYASSFSCVGFILGFSAGSATVSLMHKICDVSVYWRIPFMLGAFSALPALLQLTKMEAPKNSYKRSALQIDWLHLAKIFNLLFMQTIPFYILFVFLPNYHIIFLHQNASCIWRNYTLGMLAMMLATPMFGKIADKYGSLFTLKISNLLLAVFVIFTRGMNLCHVGCFITFGLFLAVVYGSLYGYIALAFPSAIRARIAAVLVNLVGALCGGSIPLIASMLGNVEYVMYMLVLACIISIVQLLMLKEID